METTTEETENDNLKWKTQKAPFSRKFSLTAILVLRRNNNKGYKENLEAC